VADKISAGGLLISDNVLWNGKVFDQPQPGDHSTKGIAEFTEAVAEDVRFETIILPIRTVSLWQEKNDSGNFCGDYLFILNLLNYQQIISHGALHHP
jgi:hypothetical protein